MDDNVIKFGHARKQLRRQQKEAQAAENRIKFGRTKAEKFEDDRRAQSLKSKLDAHKIDPDDIS